MSGSDGFLNVCLCADGRQAPFEDGAELLFARGLKRAGAGVCSPVPRESSWPETIRAGLRALLELFDREPELTRALLLESPSVDARGKACRERVVAELVRLLDEGRLAENPPPPFTAERLIRTVSSIVEACVIGREPALIELLNPLMAFIVLPYRGGQAARAELNGGDRPR